MEFDLAIVGAGPIGLAMAIDLADTGLSVALIDRQSATDLQSPAFDGREIALTLRSIRQLDRLGVWGRIPAGEISPLRAARVVNGASAHFLDFSLPGPGHDPLGHFVPTWAIRRALFDTAGAHGHIRLFAGAAVETTVMTAAAADLGLASGERIRSRLLVAADARLSDTRRRQGIAAAMTDFGKVMLVCRMGHERPHDQIATEWFGYGQTIASLPLNGAMSSIVLTLPAAGTGRLMALDENRFAVEIERRLEGRLGRMRLASTRHCYPLIAVYADRFAGPRFALIGDAAVGMHPVTAHGFNLGLLGQETLVAQLRRAARRSADIGAAGPLRRYEAAHRRASRPLYLATNAIARLYTDDRGPARFLRSAALRAAQHLPLIRRGLLAQLA
jgi:ubiquinone biosynthesis UbiH/UbiF/VisC/COQ6 family hydroxylase